MEGREISITEVLPLIGYSRYKYLIPVEHPVFKYQSSPAHKGNFANAVDFGVVDPRKQQTIVRAPISGIIEYAVMNNTVWGSNVDFKNNLNYVGIRPNERNLEFVEVAHIAPYIDENGAQLILEKGVRVEQGQPIAVAGLNGWITTNANGEPLSHVHILVGQWNSGLKWESDLKDKFRGLKIRWK